MKKLFAGILVLAVIACVAYLLLNSKKQPEGDILDTPKNIPSVFKLKFGHDMPIDSAQHISALKFAEIVNHRSNGRLEVQVFPAQQLGNDHQMIEAARAGDLSIILPPTAKLSTLCLLYTSPSPRDS